jgi:hypothetical protein
MVLIGVYREITLELSWFPFWQLIKLLIPIGPLCQLDMILQIGKSLLEGCTDRKDFSSAL